MYKREFSNKENFDVEKMFSNYRIYIKEHTRMQQISQRLQGYNDVFLGAVNLPWPINYLTTMVLFPAFLCNEIFEAAKNAIEDRFEKP